MSFLAKQRTSGIVYRCWPVEGGYRFTLNDGRTIGTIATVTDKEFDLIFERIG